MRRSCAVTFLCGLGLAACAPTAPSPEMVLLSVSPSSSSSDAPVSLRIEGHGLVLPGHWDVNTGKGTAQQVPTLRLGEVLLQDVRVDHGALMATLPASTPVGLYDLRASRGGASDVLPQAYRVISSPANAVALELRMLSAPLAGAAVDIEVLAANDAGDWIESAIGVVTVQGNAAEMERGRARVSVRLGAPGLVTLTASDDAGRTGRLQTWVTAGPAAALVWSGVPGAVTAGDCVGPLSLGAVDGAGYPTGIAEPVDVALHGAPHGGVSWFNDAACSEPTSEITLDLTGSGRVYARMLPAGPVALRAVAPLWPAATIDTQVDASAPAALRWVAATPRVSAGACVGPITARVEDAHGNASSQAANVSFRSDPVDSLAVFVDAQCTTPAGSLVNGAASFFVEVPPGWSNRRRLLIEDVAGVLERDALPMEVTP